MNSKRLTSFIFFCISSWVLSTFWVRWSFISSPRTCSGGRCLSGFCSKLGQRPAQKGEETPSPSNPKPFLFYDWSQGSPLRLPIPAPGTWQ